MPRPCLATLVVAVSFALGQPGGDSDTQRRRRPATASGLDPDWRRSSSIQSPGKGYATVCITSGGQRKPLEHLAGVQQVRRRPWRGQLARGWPAEGHCLARLQGGGEDGLWTIGSRGESTDEIGEAPMGCEWVATPGQAGAHYWLHRGCDQPSSRRTRPGLRRRQPVGLSGGACLVENGQHPPAPSMTEARGS